MKSFENISRPLLWSTAAILATLVAGCGSDGGSAPPVAAVLDPAGTTCVGVDCVALGTAGDYVILAQSGITNVPTSAVTGNMGVSPIDSTAITDFSLSLDTSGEFSTSAQVTGKIYAADYAAPTPANLTAAIGDMSAAALDAAGRATGGFGPDPTAGTLNTADCLLAVPDVYTWTTGLAIGSDCTLSGSATDVWIFQIDGNLSQTAGTNLILAGGAKPENIFWQVTGNVVVGAGSHFEGIVLSNTDITLETGATMNGRLYSGTAVNLQSSTVKRPGS